MRSLAPQPGLSRSGLLLAVVLGVLVSLAAPASADWPTYGTNLGSAAYDFFVAHVFPNADGGGTVGYFWRVGGTQVTPRMLLARVAGNGALLANHGSEDVSAAASDGTGGIYLANNSYGPTTVARWPATAGWPPFGGVTLAPGLLEQSIGISCDLTSDGGCLVAWADGNRELFASAVRSDATQDPGWPSAGLDLGPTGLSIAAERVAADELGGGYVAWWGSGGAPPPLRLSRVSAAGTIAAGWPEGGIILRQATFNNVYVPPGLIRLAGGDVMVLSTTGSGDFTAGQFILHRVRLDGTFAPGFGAAGRVVRGATNVTSVPQLVPDGGDGAFLVWADPVSNDVRAFHVLGDGSIAPGWSAAGLRVSAPAAIYVPTAAVESGRGEAPRAYNFKACPDGSGGLFVGWDDQRGATGASAWIAHWTGDGIPGTGWTVDGRMVNDPALPSRLGGLAPAGGGSLLAAWAGKVSDFFFWPYNAFLAKVDPETPTPVLVSLVSAAAIDGHVRVVWSLGGAGAAATVHRSAAGGPWLPVATLLPDGGGRIVYDDAAVEPGVRYGYRLGIMEGGVETLSAEAWVEVPRLELALEGAWPNPSSGGEVAAMITLTDATPARLEVLDLLGRRVEGAEVGSLGPGRHWVTLARPGSLPPGLYLLRLTQHSHQRFARMAVLK